MVQVWDLKDLGLQASQRIAQASDPLRLLTHVSQNFPTLAASLSRLPVNASLAAEVRANQRSLPTGASMHHLHCCLTLCAACVLPVVLPLSAFYGLLCCICVAYCAVSMLPFHLPFACTGLCGILQQVQVVALCASVTLPCSRGGQKPLCKNNCQCFAACCCHASTLSIISLPLALPVCQGLLAILPCFMDPLSSFLLFVLGSVWWLQTQVYACEGGHMHFTCTDLCL